MEREDAGKKKRRATSQRQNMLCIPWKLSRILKNRWSALGRSEIRTTCMAR